jgi:hypothetical protein
MHMTAETVALIDVREQEPPNGAKVLALTQGGKLVEATWKHNSKDDFDAWCSYPKVPEAVKERQVNRYK